MSTEAKDQQREKGILLVSFSSCLLATDVQERSGVATTGHDLYCRRTLVVGQNKSAAAKLCLDKIGVKIKLLVEETAVFVTSNCVVSGK